MVTKLSVDDLSTEEREICIVGLKHLHSSLERSARSERNAQIRVIREADAARVAALVSKFSQSLV